MASGGSFKDGKTYWDSHYAGDSSEFDWYQQYGHLEVLLGGIPDDANVLITGAGTSMLGPSLAAKGVANVTCIEQCQSAVSSMKTKYGNNCKWDCGDATSMPYANDSFDYVVDKAVLDAMLCQEGGTRISQDYLKQVTRVLKTKGQFLCVSTGHDDIRMPYFTHSFEDVSTDTLTKPSTARSKMSTHRSTTFTFAQSIKPHTDQPVACTTTYWRRVRAVGRDCKVCATFGAPGARAGAARGAPLI